MNAEKTSKADTPYGAAVPIPSISVPSTPNSFPNYDLARLAYKAGTTQCPSFVPLWINAAALEEKSGQPSKARALLEQARLRNPKNDWIWLAAVRTEERAGKERAAEALLARALKECPTSGRLWAEAIRTASVASRRAKAADALKKCDTDALVAAAVAALFYQDRKVDKARSWLARAVALDSDLGDIWAMYYKFEMQYGTPEQQQAVMEKFKKADPKHGERWCRVVKDLNNAHLPSETLLKKCVVDLETLPPP
uniref:Suppressor of forked domain-containing protein n=1 Tax=Polytomella parva TaxID=51329 RepID=A0A7S0UWL8_9CHLO